MKFTLVTTSLNEAKSFVVWKEDILAQTRPPDEIVIVDSLSTDGLREALEHWAVEDQRVRIHHRRSNAARGRNLAVEFSTGDVVVSTDMGCRLEPLWFELLCQPFLENPVLDVVAGTYDVNQAKLESAAAWADYYLNGGYQWNLTAGFLPSNRSVAYKKDAWNALGGLPEDLTLCADDLVMSSQLAASDLKVVYICDALVHWERPKRLSAFWREQYRYGVGKGEADIMRPMSGYLYALGGSRLRIYLDALRAVRHQIRACCKALLDGRICTAILIPILAFGNTVSLNYGFAAGYKSGALHCQACRSRLKSVNKLEFAQTGRIEARD